MSHGPDRERQVGKKSVGQLDNLTTRHKSRYAHDAMSAIDRTTEWKDTAAMPAVVAYLRGCRQEHPSLGRYPFERRPGPESPPWE